MAMITALNIILLIICFYVVTSVATEVVGYIAYKLYNLTIGKKYIGDDSSNGIRKKSNSENGGN